MNVSFIVFDSPRWVQYIFGSYMIVLFILSVCLNSAALSIFIKFPKFVNQNSIFNIAILLNGLALTFSSFLFVVIAEFGGDWYEVLSTEACVAEAALVYFFGLAALYLHVVISVHRLYSLTILVPRGKAKVWKLGGALGLCYLTALIQASLPFFGFGDYGPELHGTSCGLVWTDHRPKSQAFLIQNFVVSFIVPFLISSQRVGPDHGNAFLASRKRKEFKVIKMSCLVVVVFVVSWTPYAVTSFYIMIGSPQSVSPIVTRLASLLAKSAVVWKPIIYVLMAESWYTALRGIVWCTAQTDSRPEQR